MQHTASSPSPPIIVGISGGSGAAIAKRIIDTLLDARVPVICTITSGGRQVWAHEMDQPFARSLDEWSRHDLFAYYSPNQLSAPIASGGIPTRGMIVASCSMATVAAISHGLGDNLLRRAADVTIKERRPCILIPRETPLSAIHLGNMQRLAALGVTILMPAPAFYLRPRTVDDIVNYMSARALNAIDPQEFPLPASLRYAGLDTDDTHDERASKQDGSMDCEEE